jgi:outer membrane receptor protein involved in Fe transport
MHLQRTFTNVSGHVGLAWKPVQNLLLYYSAADGFRAGGFNRSGRPGGASPLNEGFGTSYPFQAIAVAHGGWWPSQEYRPDRLVSHELGWKMHWLDRRIASSGALYQEDWRHVQTSSVSPTDFPTIVFNGGDYRVRGVETELALRPLPGLTLDLSASWMHSALVRKPPLLWRDGTPIDLSALQSALTGQPFSSRAQTLGTSLASAPPSQLHAVVRYEFPGLSRRPFVQLDFRRQSHSFTSIGLPSFDVLGQDTRYELPPFSIAGLATGVRGPDWSLDLYADNLGDVRAQLSANYAQFYKAVTVVRPRTVGVRFRYDLRGRPGP